MRTFDTAMAVADQRLDVLAMSIEDTAGAEIWELIATAVDQTQPLLDTLEAVQTARREAQTQVEHHIQSLSAAAEGAGRTAAELSDTLSEARDMAMQLREERERIDTLLDGHAALEQRISSALTDLEAEREQLRRETADAVAQVRDTGRAELDGLQSLLARVDSFAASSPPSHETHA